MKNNEALEVLQNISHHFKVHDWGYVLNSKEFKAIQHAIKCLEMMPELVDAFDEMLSAQKDNYAENMSNIEFEIDFEKELNLLKKAKELIA